jgi:FMN phosphatase YigB (HAD superfamily)
MSLNVAEMAMIPLRIAFDMDGTLADLAMAYVEVEDRLFGPAAAEHEQPAPEEREAEQHDQEDPGAAEPSEQKRERRVRLSTRHRDKVWQTIEATPNFWTTLRPIEEGAVERLYQLTCEHNWEVFFITQRPATAGGTVQWQTYKWLVEHGFAMPSVIPLSSSRGKAAAALRLDYLIDDTPQNCVDVLSESEARVILLVDPRDALSERSARRLGIGTAHTVYEVLEVLVQATEARTNPSLFEKLRQLVGWR